MVKRNFLRVLLCVLLMLTFTVTPVVTATSAQASTMKLMKVNVDGGRLREGPSSAYNVITTLKKGEKVFYSGKMSKAFCYVCTSEGKVGFIYKEFLSNYGSVRSEQVYYTVSGNVKIYNKPATSGSKSITLKKKQFVIVYKKAGNWAYIKTLNGQGGFIPLNKLKKA